jgi:hypothetical protein
MPLAYLLRSAVVRGLRRTESLAACEARIAECPPFTYRLISRHPLPPLDARKLRLKMLYRERLSPLHRAHDLRRDALDDPTPPQSSFLRAPYR